MDSLLSELTVDRISAHLRGPDSTAFQAVHPVQIEHRVEIAKRFFGTGPGCGAVDVHSKSLLEVGCGQGDMSIVLAEMVGEGATVVGLYPAPLTYGAPMNLGQAQAILKSSAVGSRLHFVRGDVPSYFSKKADGTPTPSFEAAVVVHSLFYFPSEAALFESLTILRKANPPIKHLCLAEWALTTSNPTAIPHLLAIFAQSFLPKADANVQTIFSPVQLKKLAERAGWKLKSESVIANPGIQDGRWEVDMTLALQREREEELSKAAAAGSISSDGNASQEADTHRNLTTFSTLCDSIRSHLPDSGSTKGVTCVDVWTAVFEAA
ncbi:unnamed protein product [Tilletia laevis]|uniref:Methyltransferase domain-containing protein n=2 Tax=Tilletia TaxID=13289 RepID=A0A177UXN1_9BASI|nr:hypothetical protein CF336_g7732 [Tilletia laevis]KAE8246801.1 hypothetical protein A4X03_0g7207 [Tilletia caries]KAE8187303.1 hypothetical protein CF335_g7214 [Tilletia laevis]CAD6892550.1 unnamed protein product [Tilletia caries]CAD6939287.1 unnamed protein product [Tilletia caries]